MNAIVKLHKLCPSWHYHVRRTWAMEPPFRTHWFCRYCPIKAFNGIGMAWRRTMKGGCDENI